MKTLIEEINRLHGGEVHHSIEDYFKFINLHTDVLKRSLEMKALHPYRSFAELYHFNLAYEAKSLDRFKEGCHKIEVFGKLFHFQIPSSKKGTLLGLVSKESEKIYNLRVKMTKLFEEIENNIKLEILPNKDFDGEKIYLAQGYIFLEKYGRTLKIYNSEKGLDFKLIDDNKVSNIDDFFNSYIRDTFFGTVGIAKNTSKYPLEATVIPVLRNKYIKGCQK